MTDQSAPDLTLAGLHLRVLGYQYPNLTDVWDGNWLCATARCKAPGATVKVTGAFLETVAVASFRAEVVAVYETLSGTATLASNEPNLWVQLTATPVGQVRMHVEITGHLINGRRRAGALRRPEAVAHL